MKKFIPLLIIVLLHAGTAYGTDGYLDSLRRIIKETKEGRERILTQLKIAQYCYYILQDDSVCSIAANEAVISARQQNLKQEEAEARYWLTFFTYSTAKARGRQALNESLAFTRLNKLYAAESRILSLGARFYEDPDSAQLMARQALSIADKYGLPLEKAMAFTATAGQISGSRPDSAGKLLSAAARLINSLPSGNDTYTAMRNLGRIWTPVSRDSAKKYMYRALQIARERNLVMEQVMQMGFLALSQGAYFMRDSLDSFDEKIRLLCRQYKIDSVTHMTEYIQSSQDVGNNNAALRTGFQLIQIGEANKDSVQLFHAYQAIGLSYEYSFDYKTAITYLNKARQFKKWDEFTYLFSLDDLALCHLKSGNKDSARYYAAAAYEAGVLYYKSGDKIFGGLLNDLGIIHMELGDDSLALNYLQRSYQYYQKPGTYEAKNIALTTSALATYFRKHNQPDSVRYYGLIAVDISRTGGFLENITSGSAALAEYYLQKNKLDSAYYYQSIGFDAYKKRYSFESSRDFQRLINEEQQRVDEIVKAQQLAAQQYSNNLKIYGLAALLTIAIIVAIIVSRNNRQRRKSYDLLKKQKQEIDVQKLKLEESIQTLNAAQAQLIQAEKMASLGELTAGIAHEIQNPLNFVNNFSEISSELIEEVKSQYSKLTTEELDGILEDIDGNLKKIVHHGKRADSIVKGMLQHSRKSSGQKELTDINALCDEYLRLSYHGLRAKDKTFNANFETSFDQHIGKVNVVPQEIGRVILNLINNAFYAVTEKAKLQTTGYKPIVTVATQKNGNKVSIRISDNGTGIPENAVEKIFQPFFTTKPTGQGTGLGLSMSYDIVTKTHSGALKVETKQGEGTTFIIELPIN